MRRTAFLRKPPDADRLTVKLKKCKCCKSHFTPRSGLQVACGIECAQALAKAKREKEEAAAARAERKADRAKREKLKTRSDWMKEAQVAFNAWVKERDAELPCVSCGRYHQGQYHAGHYLSVGARPALRFEPLNVWKQCAPCNTHLSGNLVLYRQELIRRIGIASVEWLEGHHEAKKYSVDELRAMAKEYRAKARQLRKD